VFGRRCTRWAIVAAVALSMASPVATGDAETSRTGAVPRKLLGIWHKTMTKAEWERAGVTRDVGVYVFVVKKTGLITIYRPGAYLPTCGACQDFTTTFTTTGGRLTLGSVPVCSFKGVYSWRLAGRALIVTPVADKRCVVRAAFFGGRWQR
jgi:hypothetical protein